MDVIMKDTLVAGDCMLCNKEHRHVWLIYSNKIEIRICVECLQKIAKKVFGKDFGK